MPPGSDDEEKTQTSSNIPNLTRTSPTEAAAPSASTGTNPGNLAVPGKRSRGLSSSRWLKASDEDLTPKPLFGGRKTPPVPAEENLTPKPLNFGFKKQLPAEQSAAGVLDDVRLRGGIGSKDGSQGPPPSKDKTPGYPPPPGDNDEDDAFENESEFDHENDEVPGSKSGWEKPQKKIEYKTPGNVMGLIGDEEAPIPPQVKDKTHPNDPPAGDPPGGQGSGDGNGEGPDSANPIPPRTPSDRISPAGPPLTSLGSKDLPSSDNPPPLSTLPGGGGDDDSTQKWKDLTDFRFEDPPDDEYLKRFEILEKGRVFGVDDSLPRTPVDQTSAKEELLVKLAAARAAAGGNPDPKIVVEGMKQESLLKKAIVPPMKKLPQEVLDFRNAALGQTTPPWPEARVALEAALEAGTDASGQAFQATIELQQARADLATAQATIETFDHDGGIARLTKDLDDVKKSTKNRTMTKEEYDAHLEEQTKTLRDQLDAKDRAADSERATANEKISELTEEPDRLKANNDKLKKELDDLKKGYDDLKNEKDIIKKQNVILKKDNSDLTVLNDRIGELEADLEDAKSVSEDQTTKAECDERIKKETKRLQDEINRLQKQLEVCDAKNKLAIAQRESKISQLEADKGEHDAKISKYRLEITHKNQQIADLDRTVENMLTEAACASKNAEALAQKDKKIKDLEGGKVRLQQKISELQKDITDKHKDIAGLKASKQSLITEDDCAAKNKKALADKDKRITELEAVNQQLRSKAPSADWVPQGTHTERVNAVSARIADLEQRLHDPDAEVTRLGGELAGLNIQTAPLLPPAQIAQDNAEITRLTNELAACKAACDNEKKRLKTEIDRLNKKIAKNQSDYNSEYTRLNDEIEAKLYDYDDEENRLTKEIADLKKKLAGSKAKEQIIPTADPARVHSLLTRYLKDSTRAEIERLNDAIAIKEAACDAEKRILKDEITAHQCANDEQLRAEIAANKVDCDTEKNELSGQLVILQDENASFIRTRVADQTKICDMQKRIRYLQKQVDGDTNAAIKAKDAEIERLKGEIKSHQNTITTLETGKEDLNTRTDSQRFNSVTEHQNRRLRARIPALGIQIRTITGQDPPTPPSPTGSGDGSLAPLNNNYTPTTETNDFHILRIDIMLMGMVHKRAAYGFVKGDADVAMEAVNNAVQDAQTFRDSLPQDTPAREAELGRALYWQGLVAYYADQFNSAVTCFDQSDSLVWTHPDRSNLRGWIEWCQGVKRVDESAVSYMADKGENRRKRRPERRKKSRRPGPPPGTPSSETESEKIRRQFGSGT